MFKSSLEEQGKQNADKIKFTVQNVDPDNVIEEKQLFQKRPQSNQRRIGDMMSGHFEENTRHSLMSELAKQQLKNEEYTPSGVVQFNSKNTSFSLPKQNEQRMRTNWS